MIPVFIGGCFAMYRPAPGPAVLMCPAFGDEALKSARVWRDLAIGLAGQGLASLRFDLPGTGNSAGEIDEPGRVASWREAVRACAGWLAERHDGRIVLFGYRLGALLALDAVAGGVKAERLVLLDPPASGAALVRYLRGRARMAAQGAPPEGSAHIQVGGLPLSPDALHDLSLLPAPLATAPPALLMLAEGATAATSWPDRLRAAGSEVETRPFEGYDAFVRLDAFRASPPGVVSDGIVAYLASAVAPACGSDRPPPRSGAQLVSATATEQPIRFGPDGGMFGIFCQPHRAATAPAVLLPTTGADPCSGLSRMWTELARRLASHGIASLRFDMSGIGESEGSPGRDLMAAAYHPERMADLCRAVDALADRGFAEVTVIGYCSGAYAAWNAALSERRITGLVTGNLLYLNQQRMLADDVLRLQPGSSRLGLASGGLMRFLPRRGLAGLRRVDDWVRRLVPVGVRRLLRRWEAEQIATRRHMNALAARGCAIRMVTAEDDHGHLRLRRAFGERLRLPANLELAVIPGADHQFSDRSHRAQFLALAEAFALRRLSRTPAAPAGTPVRILETA